MAHVPRLMTEPSAAGSRDLFKADHPREIDRHIAFFGEANAGDRDMCGEALLDALTHRSSDTDEAPSCA